MPDQDDTPQPDQPQDLANGPHVLPPEAVAAPDDDVTGGLSGDEEGLTGVPHPDESADAALSEGDLARLRASNVDAGVYELRLAMDESACADCLVPDPTLVSIATDALQRRGVPVASMSVLRPAAHA